MTKKEQLYITAILAHVGMGFVFFTFPFLGYIYGLLILLVGIYYVVKTEKRNYEIVFFEHNF